MDNFFRNFAFRREATGSASSAEEAKPGQGSGNFLDRAVTVSSQKAALSVPAFARGIQVIADTLSQCIMQYQKYDQRLSCFVLDNANKGLAIGRRMNYLVQVKPNPHMTWTQLVRQATHNQYFKGNAYIYVKRNAGGEVAGFYLCKTGTYNSISDTYNIQYDITNIALSNVPSSDIIHLRAHYSNDNGLTGISIFDYARSALSIAATNDKQTLDTAAKGGKVKLLLQEEKQGGMGIGRAAKKEMEKITQQLNEDVYSKDVMLLSNVASVTPVSTSQADMQMADMRKFSVREVARLLGVPAILLMDDSNSTYKSPEAAMQAFLMYCISPLVNEWETEFNAKVVDIEGYGTYRFHFCTNRLMRLDPQAQANLDKVRLESGWTLNEIRNDEDLPSIPGAGDIHYVSTNLAELGSDKLKGTTTSPAEEKGATV